MALPAAVAEASALHALPLHRVLVAAPSRVWALSLARRADVPPYDAGRYPPMAAQTARQVGRVLEGLGHAHARAQDEATAPPRAP